MGHWDDLCFICGISPIPPSEIYTDSSYGATDLAEKILEHHPSLLEDRGIDAEQLEEILGDALDSEPRDHPGLESPEQRWESFQDAIAIGHFCNDGDTPHELVTKGPGWMRRIPDGVGVETRLVRDVTCGDFAIVVHRTANEGGSGVSETEEQEVSRASSANYCYSELRNEDGIGNFWISEGCYHYAEAWVDFSSLPKASWHARDLPFSGELYEIINSRERGRGNGVGTHPEFSYDGIDLTLEQTQYQYHAGMKQPTEVVAAIRRGAPPEELHSAIIKDCRCWMFYSPDIWPTPTNNQHKPYTQFTSPSPSPTGLGSLSTFPLEILTHCLSHLDSLHSYLTLSQSSKSLHNLLAEPAYLNRILRQMAAHPYNCLFWIRPVDTLTGERKKANAALATWLPIAIAIDTHEPPEPANTTFKCPLDDPGFPYLYFLHACYASDSMMNRKRLWGQIKQLEVMWRDYRVNGWRVDRFGVALPSPVPEA